MDIILQGEIPEVCRHATQSEVLRIDIPVAVGVPVSKVYETRSENFRRPPRDQHVLITYLPQST